jgi:hypothetical protein
MQEIVRIVENVKLINRIVTVITEKTPKSQIIEKIADNTFLPKRDLTRLHSLATGSIVFFHVDFIIANISL